MLAAHPPRWAQIYLLKILDKLHLLKYIACNSGVPIILTILIVNEGTVMRMHKIDIDQEVLDYLKSQAEPFTDTPNDVLRRFLLGKTSREHFAQIKPREGSSHNPPPVPAGTPKALEHILQVVYLIHFSGIPRSKATKDVARMHGGIAPQTVLDKYCRQLNLKASEFDRFIAEPGFSGLKEKLYAKFRGHSEVIDNYLNEPE
jgi:hypothetical protein